MLLRQSDFSMNGKPADRSSYTQCAMCDARVERNLLAFPGERGTGETDGV